MTRRLEDEDKYKFCNDLTILELVMMGGLLAEYNFATHVASDIGRDQLFLDTSNLKTQSNITELEHWTETNKTNKAYNKWRVDGEAKNYQTSGGLVE